MYLLDERKRTGRTVNCIKMILPNDHLEDGNEGAGKTDRVGYIGGLKAI